MLEPALTVKQAKMDRLDIYKYIINNLEETYKAKIMTMVIVLQTHMKNLVICHS